MYNEAPPRLGATRLADGRVLGWSEWGPPQGAPVVLCPGAATSRRLGVSAGVPAALGVRLVSLDRPGLGVSSPDPARTLLDFASDVQEFSTLRGLGRPAVLGNSQGAPFALACAAAGVTTAAAVVAGADEVAAPEFRASLAADLRALVDTIVGDPVRAQADFLSFDADRMWNMVLAGSPDHDLAVYQDPDFATAYRQALEDAFAQGPAGYARDTVLAMGRWGLPLAETSVPVSLWYGSQDTSHSPDQGLTLTARIPGALRHLVPGAGGSLLWTHGEQVLTALLSATEHHR